MIVIADASAVGAFLLADEAGPSADFARSVCNTQLIHVPSIWPAEIASLVLSAHRRKRINDSERDEALAAADLVQRIVRIEPDEPITVIAGRAAQFGLSAYDTTYALLARRLDAALLTGDGPLRRVAERQGLKLLLP